MRQHSPHYLYIYIYYVLSCPRHTFPVIRSKSIWTHSIALVRPLLFPPSPVRCSYFCSFLALLIVAHLPVSFTVAGSLGLFIDSACWCACGAEILDHYYEYDSEYNNGTDTNDGSRG